MKGSRILHDIAFAAATFLTERAEPKDVKEFHRTAYDVVREAILGYEEQRAHEADRPAAGRAATHANDVLPTQPWRPDR